MPSQRKTITLRLDRRRTQTVDPLRSLDPKVSKPHPVLLAEQQRVSEIVHDLKSPLARLTVALGLARQKSGLNAQEALDRIEVEAERLNQMLQQLLGLAKLEEGMKSQATQEINLLELVKAIAADANFEASHLNRSVQVSHDSPCMVTGTKVMLRSAIENVARNALAYTPEGTAVEISITLRGNGKACRAFISIRDHGPGVSESLLREIFRPFYRAPDSTRSNLCGTGLGLAIAERAVRLHGGSITATNHPEGGLLVEIQLPARAVPETSIAFRSTARIVSA